MVYLAGKVAPGHHQVHVLFSGVYCGVGDIMGEDKVLVQDLQGLCRSL